MTKEYDSVVDFVEGEVETSVDDIAICGPSFVGDGGSPRVMEQQAVDLSSAGYSVDIFTIEADIDPPSNVSIQTVSVTGLGWLDRLMYPFSPQMILTYRRLREYDLAISHRPPLTYPCWFSSIFSDVEHITWYNPSGDPAAEFSSLPAKAWIKLLHYWETKSLSVTMADHICCISEDSLNYFQSSNGIDAYLIPNKANKSRFQSPVSKREFYRRYEVEPEDTLIVFVGRITEKKNVLQLVECFNQVSTERDSLHLLIIGSPSMKEYADRIETVSSERVDLVGYVPDDELARIYRESDIFASCSLEEGWGLPISEASEFDNKIVCYDVIPAVSKVDDPYIAEKADSAEFIKQLKEAIDDVS